MIKIGQLAGEYKVGSASSIKDIEKVVNETIKRLVKTLENVK